MTAPQDQIQQWADLANAATPAPWTWDEKSTDEWPSGDQDLSGPGGTCVLHGWGYDASGIDAEPADRAFIAASREAVPVMAKALHAVLEAHYWYCMGCEMSKPEECAPSCGECADSWPCATVDAICDALGVQS